MDALKLYQDKLSGNCYKVRLTASLVGLNIEIKDVNLFKGETRTAEFKSDINPSGQLPVLQIGTDTFLPESNAAIHYLAETSSPTSTSLIPSSAIDRAQMLRWMFFEQYTHEPNVAVRRFLLFYVGEKDLNDSQRARLGPLKEGGEKALGIMEGHLAKRDFFVGDRMTLADIALYAYTHVSEDGGFDLSMFPNVQAWCHRITQQPGYIPMS